MEDPDQEQSLSEKEIIELYLLEGSPLVRKAILAGVTYRLEDVDDLEQEVMMKIVKNRHRFTPGTSMSQWAASIAKNTMIDSWRKNRAYNSVLADYKDKTSALQADPPLPDVRLDGQSDRKQLMEILDSKLSPDFKDVIICVDLLRLSYKETADKLDCPQGTVMSRLSRARRKLNIKKG